MRALWPPAALLVAEAASLGVIAAHAGAPPVSPPSLLTALIILTTGLLPAVLRPAHQHTLAGLLGIVFAAFLLIPFEPPLEDILQSNLRETIFSPYLGFRLVNGNLIGPLFFHLTHNFPRRAGIPKSRLLAAYLVPGAQLLLFFAIPVASLRRALFIGMIVTLFALTVCGMRQLLLVSRDPAPERRREAQQARLLLAALLAANSGIVLRLLFSLFLGTTLPYNFALVTQILLPLGIAYSILKHDLFGIDAALRRALAYGALSLIVLALYLGLTLALTELLRQVFEPYRTLAASIGVLLAALAFNPLQMRLQALIDRLLYPDKLRFRQAVGEAQQALSRVVSRQQIFTLLNETFPQAIGCRWGRITLAPAPDVPQDFPSLPMWSAPLIVGGASLGRYWLGPRQTGPSFEREEQVQLRALTTQAALALAYARALEEVNALNRDLERRVRQRSEQVLAQQRTLAALSERQRLARELHDSVNQTLFSISLSARAIRNRLPPQAEETAADLSALEAAARQALGQMRALMAQLRAPLEETQTPSQRVDLGERLRQSVAELAASARAEIRLDLPENLDLPAKQAEEILAILHEALLNALRHSGSDAISCRLTVDEAGLCAVVSDEGCGFVLAEAMQMEGHFGLRGMQERAAMLGGRLEVTSTPGRGTTIALRIPSQEEES